MLEKKRTKEPSGEIFKLSIDFLTHSAKEIK